MLGSASCVGHFVCVGQCLFVLGIFLCWAVPPCVLLGSASLCWAVPISVGQWFFVLALCWAMPLCVGFVLGSASFQGLPTLRLKLTEMVTGVMSQLCVCVCVCVCVCENVCVCVCVCVCVKVCVCV